MEGGVWQLIGWIAELLWVVCSQLVQILWLVVGKIVRFINTWFLTCIGLWEYSRFLHGLYHFFTQGFPLSKPISTPLLFLDFSTLSTQPIKTTTI